MRLIFKFIWLGLVRYYWTVAYALSTSHGQVTPETPWQKRLFAEALAATLNLELLLVAHSQETK
jgi:hypothetical protein